MCIRSIFAAPAMMFYSKELKRLYDAVNNVDLFCAVLREKIVFRVLAHLSGYPAVFDFISALAEAGKGIKLIRGLTRATMFLDSFIKQAQYFATVKEEARRSVLDWSLCPTDPELEYIPGLLPSYPVNIPDRTISVGRLRGYDFEWLVTSEDYRRAGYAMNNCLAGYLSPVVVMKREGEYIAAISVDRSRTVTDTRLCDNIHIGKDDEARAAFECWARKNKFSCRLVEMSMEDEFGAYA